MKLAISGNANVNYLAKIVQIDEFKAHPDPEVNKLKCCTIDGFNIICGIDSEPGVYVYFPTSCCINPHLLSFANLYRHSELNANINESGMFDDNGRVKAIRLRKCISEGFILPVVVLENFVMSVTNKTLEYSVGDEFDCVKEGDKEFWINKKYVVNESTPNTTGSKENKRGQKSKKKASKVIDEQFRFHYDTIIIKKCPHVIQPEDYIHISSKVHGTSAISAHVLCKQEKSRWIDTAIWLSNHTVYALAKLFGHNMSSNYFPIYDHLYASRTRVINGTYEQLPHDGFYQGDALMRSKADDVIRPHLDKGMTAYYEILGYLPTGAYVQKNYDYGYEKPHGTYEYGVNFGIRVYRITLTNTDGVVHEFSPREVQLWSKNAGIPAVDEYYYGKAGDLYPELRNSENWSDDFITKLSDDKNFYMECDSPECANKVPHEGIVIKIDNMKSAAFKLKCFKFINQEQNALDKGESNIEDNA